MLRVISRLPGCAACVCLCTLAVHLGVATAGEPTTGTAASGAVASTLYDFDIPRQPLRDALQSFALICDHRLFYRSSIVAGIVSPPLEGRFTLDQAIARLLSGTNLDYQITHSGVVLISRSQTARLAPWETAMAAMLTRLIAGSPRDTAAHGARNPQADGRASADQTAGPPARLQEVVVTAERRSETVLDVPMSINVISSGQMQASEVNGFDDFAVRAPNVNFDYSEGGSVDDRGVAIRGIEGTNTTGFYLDDLPMPISLDPRVVDLDRIEVLEGPQGTLYGARSMGGTIREITTAPDLTRFSGIADLQGTRLDGGSAGYLGYLTLNVPIVTDTLALRITPYRGQDGGWLTRKWPVPGYTPGVAPPGDQKTTTYDCECEPGEVQHIAQQGYDGLNAQLLWRPIANLAIRPKFLYQKLDSNGLPLGNYSAGNTTNYMHFDIPEGTYDQFMFYGGTIDYSTPIGTLTSATSGFDRHERDYEDDSEFTAFSYRMPLLASPMGVFANAHDITQELRFASAWNFPLTLTGGLYYEKNDSVAMFNQHIVGFATPISGYGYAYGTDDTAELWNPTTYTEKALYGELTWKLSSRWSLILGERYSEDQQVAGGKVWGAIAYPDITYASSTLSLASSESDTVLTPRYVVKYQPSPNLNIYADAAKGFRPGGGQFPPGLNLCAADYAADHLTPAELSRYGPDWVWDYELGEKAFFDNRRFSLNSSVYWINWTNIQEELMFLCGEGATINSGRAVSRGAEAEFSAVPLQGLTLDGGIGYDYARIISPGALISIPPAGSPIQEVAPLTANAAGDYRHPLTPHMDWDFHLDWSYTGHRYSVANSPEFPRLIPAYFLLSARFSLLRGPAQYALFVKNMGGIHPNLSDELSTAAEAPGRPRWTEGPPATYGIEARVTF